MSTTTIPETNIDKQIEHSILSLIRGIQDDPSKANAVFRAKSELTEGFRAHISVRDFSFLSDEPKELGGTDLGPNPVEYVLGAFAACQEIVIKAYASVLGIDVNSVKVEAEGNLDLHGFLNLNDERPGFNSVSFKTVIETSETNPEKLKQLELFSVNRCPVLDIIKNPVPVNGKIEFLNPKTI
ncbi:MAG: OsmC family protein [Balneolaceae bacterium]|nr:OsmC family protein [Balneolaceae bacterium]